MDVIVKVFDKRMIDNFFPEHGGEGHKGPLSGKENKNT